MAQRPAQIRITPANQEIRYTTANYPSFEKMQTINVIKNTKKAVGVAYGAFYGAIKSFIPDAFLIRSGTDILRSDLVIFTGGEDIDPAFYNEENTHSNGVNRERDHIESNYFNIAYDRKKKIYGTCRGHQLINCLLGGSLYQDFMSTINPQTGELFDVHYGYHSLEILKKGGVIDKYFGGRDIVSCHHQGINKPTSEAIPTSVYKGIIESLESNNIITTQFHPEFEERNKQNVKDFFTFLVEEW